MSTATMTRTCKVPGDNHSSDLIRTFHGRTDPVILCGFHAQESMIADSLRQVAAVHPTTCCGYKVTQHEAEHTTGGLCATCNERLDRDLLRPSTAPAAG